jgi:diguanylate cyclase (GGDEF)-like protein/PAS domain S-box-containing protein
MPHSHYQAKFERFSRYLGDKVYFYAHDPQGVFIYVSDSVSQVLGYSPQEFKQHFAHYLTHHPDNSKVEEYTQRSLQGEQVPAYSVEVRHKNGSILWLQVQEFAVCNEHGEVIAIEGIATDITEHKALQQAVKKQNERLAKAQELAHMGCWELDMVANKLSWSDEVYKIFELDPASVEPSYSLFLQTVLADDREKVDRAYQRSLQLREAYRIDHRLQMADGRIKYVVEECETDFDVQGRPLVSRGTVQDVTAIWNLKQQVMHEQALLTETENIARIGSWEWDVVTNELWFSAGCYKIHGIEAGRKLACEDLLSQVPAEEKPAVQQMIQRAIASGEEQQVVYSIVRADGSTLYVLQRGVARYDEAGRPKRLVGTTQDITQQYLADQALFKQKQLLKSVVNATSDLIFFKDAEGRYQGCNEAFGEFVGKSEKEIVGKTDFDLFDPEVASFFREQDAVMFAGGKARQNEEWVTYPDGRSRLLDTVKTPYYGEDGRLYGLVGVSRDITERKRAEDRLYHLAHHDPLTGLANRELFTRLLEQAVVDARRKQKQLAVFFIDLDHFKQINDSMGHHVGDQVLDQVSQRLVSAIRQSDIIARLGGDEFAVLLRDFESPDDMVPLAEKMLKALEKSLQVDNSKFYVGASIGISIYPQDGVTSDVLLRNADAAMYRAKGNDRNTYAFYTDELTRKALQHVQLESELRRALKNAEFELHYQPKYDCRSRQIVGSEALIRWNHPQKGLLMPGAFIAEAEKSDLIIEIGEWVMREACRQNVQWRQQGLNPGKVSVNLSGRQISKYSLVDTVKEVLDATRCQPQWLELEVVERFVMASPEQALKVFEQIHALGVQFALDDFGIEHSSLVYLKKLPLKTLKIDSSFIRDVPEDKNDMAIIQAILAMAKSLGLTTVAEGVEKPEQLAFLLEQGTDLFQGFLLSRPLPAKTFEALLKA